MPLSQSSSPAAFKRNVKAELAAGKPRAQSLAIAYSVKRRNKADGGEVSPQPNLLEQAQAQYPILKNYDIGFKSSPNQGKGFLEYWPAGETGTPERPRPQEFAQDRAGVEVYSDKTRPIDVLGDVVSHHMITADPTIKGHYDEFSKSLQPWQHDRLREQYQHAQKEQGETRPFETWKERSGLPGYFRGYPFQQWERAEEMYTPEQLTKLDAMMNYLRGQGKARGGNVSPALDIARRAKRAAGGAMPWYTRNEARGMTGPLHSKVPGRTDHIPLNVPAGAYVLPADHVSGMGQGNTQAGLSILSNMFSSGPYGSALPGMGRRTGRKKFANGGAPEGDVPIMAAGGEYVIDPEVVAQIGGGDMDRGHKILDHWVVATRKKHVKTLSKLPGPSR